MGSDLRLLSSGLVTGLPSLRVLVLVFFVLWQCHLEDFQPLSFWWVLNLLPFVLHDLVAS